MSASEDAAERVVVLEWMGPDHTRKRISVEPCDGRAKRWLIRWEWRRDDGGWETMQATESTDVPNVGGEGGSAS